MIGGAHHQGLTLTPLPPKHTASLPLTDTLAYSPCAPRLLTLCPAPTDPVGQSWPMGTGSVGRGAQAIV